jgi:hypothetical protein
MIEKCITVVDGVIHFSIEKTLIETIEETSKLRRFNPAGNIAMHRGSDKVSVCVFC